MEFERWFCVGGIWARGLMKLFVYIPKVQFQKSTIRFGLFLVSFFWNENWILSSESTKKQSFKYKKQ